MLSCIQFRPRGRMSPAGASLWGVCARRTASGGSSILTVAAWLRLRAACLLGVGAFTRREEMGCRTHASPVLGLPASPDLKRRVAQVVVLWGAGFCPVTRAGRGPVLCRLVSAGACHPEPVACGRSQPGSRSLAALVRCPGGESPFHLLNVPPKARVRGGGSVGCG